MQPKYIDCHAHAYPSYFDNLDEVILRAKEKEVAIVNIGTNINTSKECIDTVSRYAGIHDYIYSMPGIHPCVVSESLQDSSDASIEAMSAQIDSDLINLEEMVSKNLYKNNGAGKVVGIGECGIDLFRIATEDSRLREIIFSLQKKLFVGQIEMALKYNLPIMVHARESYDEILDILDGNFMGDASVLRGNIHFFAGTVQQAMRFLDKGFTLSFTGVVTFARSYDAQIQAIPIDSMLSETDCPYVAPVPHRGKKNEPSYVIHVVDAIAGIKGEGVEGVRSSLLANASRYLEITLS